MIKKYGKKLAAVLTAAAMLLSGCGGRQAENAQTAGAADSENGAGVQMGRYVEEYMESGTQLGRITALTRLEDGRIAVFSYNHGPFVSSDEGRTWEPWQTEWYQGTGEYCSWRCAAIAPDGTIFAGYTDYSEEAEQDQEAEQETEQDQEAVAGQEDAAADFEVPTDYQLVAPDGSSRKIELEQLNGRNGNAFMTDCWYAPDGALYASDLYYIYEVNEETLTPLFETEQNAEQLCFLGEDTMLAATSDGVIVYDRKNRAVRDGDAVLDAFVKAFAEKNGSVLKYASDNYSLYLTAGEGETLYLICDEGIYSHTLGGGTMEKLLEGSLYSMGDPSEYIFGMLTQPDNCFLVLYLNAVGTCRYDADMPTLPEKELKVYSLEKDDVVQRAVSQFQKAHQDVYVNYEVGLDENSGQTKEDVIKTLNTEILAGNGPDVLILDGFPMDSYIEKGLLRDLSGVLKKAEEKDALFHNIAAVFEEEQGLFAIPMRCWFPVVIGPAGELERMNGLEGIADAAESMRKNRESGSVTGTVAELPTLQLLAMASAPAWQKGDGSVDMEAVREFYAQAQRVFAAENAGVTQEEKDTWDSVRLSGADGKIKDVPWMLISYNAYMTVVEENRMALGYADEMWALEVMFSARRQGKELECGVLKGQAQQAFYPYTIAGISASAKETELAEQFVETMLSQKAAGGSGFSVNKSALKDAVDLNDDGDGGILGAMLLASDDGDMKELTIWQLTAEEVDWLYDVLESLRTPYLQNETLETAVLETGEKLLRGEMDMEEALTEVQNRVKLSMAE